MHSLAVSFKIEANSIRDPTMILGPNFALSSCLWIQTLLPGAEELKQETFQEITVFAVFLYRNVQTLLDIT